METVMPIQQRTEFDVEDYKARLSEELGMTTQQWADFLGVNINTVYKYLKEAAAPEWFIQILHTQINYKRLLNNPRVSGDKESFQVFTLSQVTSYYQAMIPEERAIVSYLFEALIERRKYSKVANIIKSINSL